MSTMSGSRAPMRRPCTIITINPGIGSRMRWRRECPPREGGRGEVGFMMVANARSLACVHHQPSLNLQFLQRLDDGGWDIGAASSIPGGAYGAIFSLSH